MDRKLLGKMTFSFAENAWCRSQLIQAAVAEKIGELQESRLAQECSKLDPKEEKAWAELGFDEDTKSWPEY